MLKKIAITATLLFAAFLGIASMQPNEFRVSRSITIAAPAEKIFALLNSPKRMQAWSPWATIDPKGIFTFEGPESGVGAVATWSGNMELGAGKSTILESTPNTFVKTQLDFTKPMQGSDTSEFTLKETGDQTKVSWTMYGPANLLSKALGLIFNCEKMVGDMFEQGLTNLKSTSEQK